MSTTNLNGNTFAAAPTLPTGKSFSPNNETTTNGNETYANGNTTTMNMNGSARMNSFEEVLNGKNELKQQETAAPEVQDEYQGNYEPMAIVSMGRSFFIIYRCFVLQVAVRLSKSKSIQLGDPWQVSSEL